MVACRGCVGDRACGPGYGALGVHLRLPSRERGDQAPIRTAATADVNVARAALRESVPAIVGTVRGRGLSVRRSKVRPRRRCCRAPREAGETRSAPKYQLVASASPQRISVCSCRGDWEHDGRVLPGALMSCAEALRKGPGRLEVIPVDWSSSTFLLSPRGSHPRRRLPEKAWRAQSNPASWRRRGRTAPTYLPRQQS